MWRRRRKRLNAEIAPDEVLLDASNIAELDTDRFEGKMERPLGRRALMYTGLFLGALLLCYGAQAWNLQIMGGVAYAERAQENQLSPTILFADRGVIEDRTGRVLAGNTRPDNADFSVRQYADWRGIAHVVGYAKPPAKDSTGTYFRENSEGVNGVEAVYNEQLAGKNGSELTETNAVGKVVSQSTLVPPQNGAPLTLSIDAQVSQGLYDAIAEKAQQSGFQGGAGVIMDVHTGEILAMVSYPEFSLQTFSEGTDNATISAALNDKQRPLLNRAIGGLYAPGSIVKPIMALGALTEGVIDENKQILSTGSISIPNPYDPAHPSIFHDWRPQGWIDVRHAIAVSSDVYFYEVGGGFQDQKGLGIANIEKYFRLFGFGATTGLAGFTESAGSIPSPEWKAQVFPGDPWRIGDTYHTAIGQYGLTITPLQAVREASAIANGGDLLTPQLLASSTPQFSKINIPAHNFDVVRQGMRLGVTDGIAQAVKFDFVHVAAKTGTAQIGAHNEYMNSWMIGFFPYENPRYAYAIVLEKAPAGTLVGSPAAAGQFLLWMHDNAPQYLESQ